MINEDGHLRSVDEVAAQAFKVLVDYAEVLSHGGGFWDDAIGGCLAVDLVLTARHEDIAWVHSEGVCENPMQECIDAGQKPLDLIWVDIRRSSSKEVSFKEIFQLARF